MGYLGWVEEGGEVVGLEKGEEGIVVVGVDCFVGEGGVGG